MESESEGKLDFTKPIFLVKFFYSSNVTFHVVNSEDEKSAILTAVEEAKKAGEKPVTVEFIAVEKIETTFDPKDFFSGGGDSDG